MEFEGNQAITWDTVKEEAAIETECRKLTQIIMQGFPETRKEVSEELKRYWQMREELYVIEGVPFRDNQIIEALHMGHQGINGMMANARK